MKMLKVYFRNNAKPAIEFENIEQAIRNGLDLTGADLFMADLNNADLSGADLTGADLAQTDLTGADLAQADLTGADLTGVTLRFCDLRSANLAEACLVNADLSEAELEGAHFAGADLTGAIYANKKLWNDCPVIELGLTGNTAGSLLAFFFDDKSEPIVIEDIPQTLTEFEAKNAEKRPEIISYLKCVYNRQIAG